MVTVASLAAMLVGQSHRSGLGKDNRPPHPDNYCGPGGPLKYRARAQGSISLEGQWVASEVLGLGFTQG